VGVGIDISLYGETLIRRTLMRWGSGGDMSQSYREIARMLSDAAERTFLSQGRFGGGSWQRLAESTILRKRRSPDPRVRANAERIMFATGRLYHSLVDEMNADHIESIGPDSLRWGSSVPYGVYHHSRAPRSKIPYRPLVKLTPFIRAEIIRELQRSALGRARGRVGLR
jgi:phage gpG-like protein